MITKTKILLGIASIEEQVNVGVGQVESLLAKIKETKAALSGLVKAGIVEKHSEIMKLRDELSHLEDLEKAVENLG